MYQPTLKPTGEGHHDSLFAEAAKTVRSIDNLNAETLSEAQNALLRAYLDDGRGATYCTPEIALHQVLCVLDKLVTDDFNIVSDLSEFRAPEIKTEQQDLGFLESFDRVSKEELSELSPSSCDIKTEAWAFTMFNSKVLKNNFITTTGQYYNKKRRAWSFKYCYNFRKDRPATKPEPYQSEFDWSEQDFICYSTTKKHTEDLTDGEKHKCKSRIADTPYIVFEVDYVDREAYLHDNFHGFMLEMSKFAPLVAAIDTGSKSVHFWFATGSTPKKVIEYFVRQAGRCGVDKSVLTDKSKLVRLPNVTANSNPDREQKLIYFDANLTDPDNIANDWDYEGFANMIAEQLKREVYFDGQYLCQDAHGQWRKHKRVDFIDYLEVRGITKVAVEGQALSDAERFMEHIRDWHTITGTFDYLAGYSSGLHISDDGRKLLVCSDPLFPDYISAPQTPQDFKETWSHIHNLFTDEEVHYFLGWLKGAVTTCYNNGAKTCDMGKPSQFLNIIGGGDVGKTFMVKHIMSPLFGQGVTFGSPKPAFTGELQNGTQCERFLLVIDDAEYLDSSEASRYNQGEIMKSLIVSGTKSIRPMYMDRVDMLLNQVLVRILNPDKQNTLIDLSVKDTASKVIVLKIDDDAKPLGKTEADRLEKAFKKERSSFFSWLINDYIIPDEYKQPNGEDRFTVKSYCNPSIHENITNGEPHKLFIDVVNRIIEDNPFDEVFTKFIRQIDGEYHLVATKTTMSTLFAKHYEDRRNRIGYNKFKDSANVKRALDEFEPIKKPKSFKRTNKESASCYAIPLGSKYKPVDNAGDNGSF